MSVIAIVIGVAVGYAGSLMFNKSGEGVFVDMILGVIGAFVGRSAYFSITKLPSDDGMSFLSALAAVGMAALLLFLYHSVRNMQPGKERTRPQRRRGRVI